MLAEAGFSSTRRDRTGTGEQLRRLLPGLLLASSRGLAIAAQFGSQVVVAALAGASGLGVLQLFTSWVCIAGEVLAQGLPARAMRQVAVASAQSEANTIKRVLRDSRRRILQFWLCLLVLVAPVLLWLARTGDDAGWQNYLLIGTLCTAPLFALGRLYAEALKATGATLAAVTIESLFSPAVILLLCAGCWWLSQPLLALSLVIAFGISIALMPLVLRLVIGRQLLRMSRTPVSPAELKNEPAPAHQDLLYLWGSGVLSIAFLQLPFLVLPLYASTADIGVYAIAHKLVNVITTLLLLLAAVYGPRFARSAAQRDGKTLEQLLRRTQWISAFVYLPSALLLVALSSPLAGLFGAEFGQLGLLLVILCSGQLINAATGLCGVLLNMAGEARQELTALSVNFALAILASLIIGPIYGALGLACVFSASIALKNLTSYFLVSRLLKTMRKTQ